MKKPRKNQNYYESFKYAFEGLRTAIVEERNMRSHLTIAVVTLLVSLFLNLNRFEWLWVLLAIFFVILGEFINTIVENVVDLITSEYNVLAKKIKDMAAACVLLTSFFAVIIALIILAPKILELF